MKPSTLFLGLIRIPIDFFMGLLAFYLAYQIRGYAEIIPGIIIPFDKGVFPEINSYMSLCAFGLVILVAIFAISKMYSLKVSSKIGKEIGLVITLTASWLMFIIAYFFVIHEFPFSRLVLFYGYILSITLISLGRLSIRLFEYILLKNGIGRTNILIIGQNQIAETLKAKFAKLSNYHLINNPHSISNIEKLEELIKQEQIDEIIQTQSDLKNTESIDILELCRSHQIEYSFVPDLLAFYHTNVEVETINEFPIIRLKPTPLDGWGRIVKRIFDIVGATIGLILLSPIMLITAIAIKLNSKGPILFIHLDDGARVKRVGINNKLFNFYKFRSMYPNVHNLRYTELADQNTRNGSPLVKIKNDPRVTKVGKFIRKTSIDELPQLLNVIKGEMSLVGPRPHLPEEVAKYQKHHKFVLTIKPGISGLAQASGRSELDFEQEVKLDTYYIENWSLWLDIKIIIKTILVVLIGYKE